MKMGAKKLAKDGLWVLLGELVQKGTKLLFAYFVVRYVSKEDYGHYNYIMSLVSVFAIFCLPTAQDMLIQGTSKKFYGTFAYITRYSFLYSFIGSALFLLHGVYNVLFTDTSMAVNSLFFMTALLFPFTNGIDKWQSVYQGLGEFKYSTILANARLIIVDVAQIAVAVMLVGTYELPVFLLVFLVLTAAFNISSYFFLKRRLAAKNDEVMEGAKDYAISTSKYSAWNLLGNSIDKVLVFNFLSPESLAIYAIANKIPEMAKGAVQSFTKVLIARFAKQEKISKKLNAYMNVAGVLVILLVGVGGFFVLPPLMKWLFTDAYNESIWYAQILFLSIGISTFSTIKFSFVLSKLDKKTFKKINVSMSIVRVVASIILVPLYGIMGAIISTFIYRIATVFITEHNLRKYKE